VYFSNFQIIITKLFLQKRIFNPIISKSRTFFENLESAEGSFKEKQGEATESIPVPNYFKMMAVSAAAAVALGGLVFAGSSQTISSGEYRNMDLGSL